MKNLELLENILGAYFHQDFDLEYKDIREAINDIIQGYNQEDLTNICIQINEILKLTGNEDKLAEYLHNEFQIQVTPKVGGDDINTYTELLEYIRNQLLEYLTTQKVNIT